jgi:peptidoglycan/xylan/chitin deacetylase (PgdA/CDA1 family)
VTTGLKYATKRALTLPGVRGSFRWLVQDRAIIFMLHRFTDPQHGVLGLDSDSLRSILALMRRKRLRLVSLAEIIDDLQNSRSITGAIAFTMDDGYATDLNIAAGLFAEFDCPLTVFLTTGMVDHNTWFWWDKIEWLLQHTAKRELRLVLDERPIQLDLSGPAAKRQEQYDLTQRCKNVSEIEKLAFIARLADAAEVSLPAIPPAQFRPVTWDEARARERRGIRFGAHSVTHPILSRLSDSDSAAEIRNSWARLKEELASPVPIFCYPNGTEQDFGTREIDTLRQIGMRAAVSAEPGYISSMDSSQNDAIFLLPRFVMPSSKTDLTQITHGLERLKQILRS